jgi:hypothetical protein
MAGALDPEPSRRVPRPAWMTAAAAVCALTAVVSIARDLFLPASRWTEVWFGFEVTGPLALATAPVHWAIFAVAAWGFSNARSWAPPAAAAYLFYAAFAHLVWSEASPHGRGWMIGLVQAAAISSVALLVLRAHRSQSSRMAGPHGV